MAKPMYAIVVMKCETLNSFLADTFLMMKEGTTIFGKNQSQTSVSEILNVGPASERSERSSPLFFLYKGD